MKEANLAGHLENPNDAKGQRKAEPDHKDEVSIADKDYQLYEALNLLKGLHILKQD